MVEPFSVASGAGELVLCDAIAQAVVGIVQDGHPDGLGWGFNPASDAQECLSRGVFLFLPDSFSALQFLELIS